MIRELKTLIAVAREGTFAAAGDKLGLTQSAVSAQMRRLEDAFGQPIFQRAGRCARLNPFGQQILARATDLVRQYETLAEPDGNSGDTLHVTVGAIASVQRAALPAILAQFHRRFSSCHTRVLPGVSAQLADLVDAGEVDIAVIVHPPYALPRDLHWTSLTREPFRLLVPHRISGDDWALLLSSHPFVRYERTSFGGRQVDRFLRRTHLTPHDICEVDELEAVIQLVAVGVGVALVPETTTRKCWPRATRAIDLGRHTFYREVGVLTRRNTVLSEPTQRLLELISDAYGQS